MSPADPKLTLTVLRRVAAQRRKPVITDEGTVETETALPIPWSGPGFLPWFALPLPGRRLIRLNLAEHLEYCWLPVARAAAQASSWTNRDAALWLAGLSASRQRG